MNLQTERIHNFLSGQIDKIDVVLAKVECNEEVYVSSVERHSDIVGLAAQKQNLKIALDRNLNGQLGVCDCCSKTMDKHTIAHEPWLSTCDICL
ncbi:hypothetical protein [Vibrio crassostreae]|uniref:hypothetical protein n=1 Tax=Vibrio crassostreae TaxID=246167 RepID=UPI001B305C96|nr:hypothetical protein [Vibrio crassostreae]